MHARRSRSLWVVPWTLTALALLGACAQPRVSASPPVEDVEVVAVGRAMMTKPTVLMLDEPTAGVSPIVMDELFDRIIEVRDTGVAILMVEQNARQALSIADRGYVLVTGENRHTDTGEALLANPEVRKSFLGG